MTTAQTVQSEGSALASTMPLYGFGCVLGTAWEKTATTAEHWADRISVETYQRQQQVFHQLIVEVRQPCSTNRGSPAPWLAGQGRVA
jgi:hypothetical protein